MGTAYSARQSSFSDGDTIDAADSNDEFDAILSAFGTSGHTHDGTAGEGGNVTALRGHALTFGLGTSGTDIVLTFDGETSDGVLSWMEDEDQFKFDDDVQIIDDKSLILGTNEDITIKYDETTNNALEIAANVEGAALGIVLKADQGDDAGDEWKVNVADGGTLTLGNDINSAGTYVTHMTLTPNSTVANSTAAFAGSVTVANALSIGGTAITSTGAELNIMDGDTSASATTVADADRVVFNDAGTMKQVAVTDLAAYFDDEITAMPNLTSVGTLTTLTVDDIVLNGKVLTVTGDTSDTFTITSGAAGATTLATTDAAGTNGDLTLDADGDISLDGNGASNSAVFMKYNGTAFGSFYNAGTASFNIKSEVSDQDILIKGNDGGSEVTALTLDMSAAGAATFNAGVTATSFTGSGLAASSGNLTIDAQGDDTDIIFKGNDGGVAFTALTLDMSGTGWPTFNAGATFNNTIYAPNVVLTGAITANQAVVDDIGLDGKVITITGDTSDTFTITSGTNGATTLATTDAAGADAYLLLDIDGYIELDSGETSGSILFKKSGTQYGILFNAGNDLYLQSTISDGDLYLRGNDGGSTIAALKLDMSAAGKAIFNAGAEFKDNVGIGTATPLKKLHVDGPALATISALTDGTTITPNFDTSQNFSVTLGGNRTLANPTNIDAGQTGSIFVTQDGTGSRTLAFGNKWAFAGGTAPTLTTTAAAVDRIDYIVMSASIIQAVASLDVKVPS